MCHILVLLPFLFERIDWPVFRNLVLYKQRRSNSVGIKQEKDIKMEDKNKIKKEDSLDKDKFHQKCKKN